MKRCWASERLSSKSEQGEAEKTKEPGKSDDTESGIATLRSILSAMGGGRCSTAGAMRRGYIGTSRRGGTSAARAGTRCRGGGRGSEGATRICIMLAKTQDRAMSTYAPCVVNPDEVAVDAIELTPDPLVAEMDAEAEVELLVQLQTSQTTSFFNGHLMLPCVRTAHDSLLARVNHCASTVL